MKVTAWARHYYGLDKISQRPMLKFSPQFGPWEGRETSQGEPTGRASNNWGMPLVQTVAQSIPLFSLFASWPSGEWFCSVTHIHHDILPLHRLKIMESINFWLKHPKLNQNNPFLFISSLPLACAIVMESCQHRHVPWDSVEAKR